LRVLLDTHVFLWAAAEPERLPKNIRALFEEAEAEAERFLSVASIWEIAIKSSFKKLRLPMDVKSYVATRLKALKVGVLPIEARHAVEVAELPAHHRDPFDRLLVAQAILESLQIASSDKIFRRYDVELVR
jgi:PIN domain nuclease of toxin-antitoxin system